MVDIAVRYLGDLRCEAQHGPSGVKIITDAPVDNHGKGESFSPTDLAATSLGACMMTIMGIAAQRKSIDLKGTEIRVKKIMAQDTPRRIARLEVDFAIPLQPDHPDRKLLENAALSCPVHHSLHPQIEQAVHFHWNG